MKLFIAKHKTALKNVLIGSSGASIITNLVMNPMVAFAAVDYNSITTSVESASNNIVNLIKMLFLACAAVWAICWFIALGFGGEQTKQRAKTMLFWALVATAGVMMVDTVVEFFTSLWPTTTGGTTSTTPKA